MAQQAYSNQHGTTAPEIDIDIGGWPTVGGASVSLYLRPAEERDCGRPLVYTFGHVGPGTPEAAWNGRELYLGSVPTDCNEESLRDYLQSHEDAILALASRYHGSEINDHGNRIGSWEDDGEDVDQILDVPNAVNRGEIARNLDACDYLSTEKACVLDRACAEGIDAAAAGEVSDAEVQGVMLREDDVRDYLQSLVDAAVEDGTHVWVETMPDHLRASHRAAGNWGVYPHNGAERRLVEADDAEEIVEADPDGYARIVE